MVLQSNEQAKRYAQIVVSRKDWPHAILAHGRWRAIADGALTIDVDNGLRDCASENASSHPVNRLTWNVDLTGGEL